MSEHKVDISKPVNVVIDGQEVDGFLRVRANTDANFMKVWIDLMMVALGIAGEKKGKVIGYLLKNKDSNNRVHGTFDTIAKEAKVGRGTVASTLKALQDSDLVTKELDGVYVLNPNWVWTGGAANRLRVMLEFQELKYPGQTRYSLEKIPMHTPTPESSAAE
tara:strand:- start:344 stop:829 length:486 start_codon:yes stop_codon:yes gene_type:complete